MAKTLHTIRCAQIPDIPIVKQLLSENIQKTYRKKGVEIYDTTHFTIDEQLEIEDPFNFIGKAGAVLLAETNHKSPLGMVMVIRESTGSKITLRRLYVNRQGIGLAYTIINHALKPTTLENLTRP